MIGILINVLVLVLVFVVIWWVIQLAATALGLPAQVQILLKAILALIALLEILSMFGLGVPHFPMYHG